MGSNSTVSRIEEVLVGVFGAFIGGEFVADMLSGGKSTGQFSMTALATGIGGAVVLLMVLRLMRKAVGPLRSSRGPGTRRR
jgi:uncharacterized membrane protein YeaQ/YmgE (transglycosylase-associated protein family)